MLAGCQRAGIRVGACLSRRSNELGKASILLPKPRNRKSLDGNPGCESGGPILRKPAGIHAERAREAKTLGLVLSDGVPREFKNGKKFWRSLYRLENRLSALPPSPAKSITPTPYSFRQILPRRTGLVWVLHWPGVPARVELARIAESNSPKIPVKSPEIHRNV